MDKTGWTYKKLNELGEIITGGTPPTIDERNYSSSDYCFIKPSDLNDRIVLLDDSEFHISSYAYNNARKLPKGAVLVCCIGSIGKIGILNTEATCNQQINAIIPKSDISSKFIAYSILSSKKRLLNIANAPVVPIINKTQFSKFEIKICSPIEQQYIVEELDSINESISLLQQQVKDLDALAQSIFYDMFGDPIENSKHWDSVKLGTIAEPTIGLTYKPENVSTSEEGTIVLRSSNIQESELSFEDIVRVNIPIKDEKFVKDGDILMCSRNGSFKLVGKVAMIKGLSERMSYGAFMTIIRSDYNSYLFAYFKTPAFREHLNLGKTSTVNQVTVNMLKNISLPLPPYDLQRDFSLKIATIDDAKNICRSQIAEMQKMLASRMQYWFE